LAPVDRAPSIAREIEDIDASMDARASAPRGAPHVVGSSLTIDDEGTRSARTSPSPTKAGRAKSDVPKKIERRALDLSAYEVDAMSADAMSADAMSADARALLPRDKSLSPRELEGHMKASEKEPYDGGRGLLGDAYRGAQRIVGAVDEATLDASRRALGRVAEPESAKIRPHADGARLHIDIPPQSVKIGR
ncbi:MAG: hypothetical protein IJR14_00930, partial [Synergistaceae bacterium]|nr:hypothetical protein [Synergistaceae bacterium]